VAAEPTIRFKDSIALQHLTLMLHDAMADLVRVLDSTWKPLK
jgi:hypothetical protein